MPESPYARGYDDLPLWGQVLLAVRALRRFGAAVLAERSAELMAEFLAACDELETAARDGSGPVVTGFAATYPAPIPAVAAAVLAAVEAAAEGGDVGSHVRAALDAIAADRRVNRLQLAIVFGGDVNLIRFACREVPLGRKDALTSYVFERLTPAHPLTLEEPKPSPEDLFR
jgi:hypothetical protein